MLKFIRKCIATWKDNSRRERRAKGFDHAASFMLHNPENGVAVLKQYVRQSMDFNHYDDFDAGVEQAIAKWKELFK